MNKLIDFIITKIAGKLLIVNGLAGIIVNVRFDCIAGRAAEAFEFGYMQQIALWDCVGMIIVGFVLDNFMKDM